jgi:hypothetical protein
MGVASSEAAPPVLHERAMSKSTVVLVLLSGLVLGILAPIYAHASLIETGARDRSTGPFNPNLPAEARRASGS